VVAAKSLVAAALLGLLLTTSALADAPTVKISSADQAKAGSALLRRADLGAGWSGGQVKSTPITPPDCPDFSPKKSDLTVTGHANARFVFHQLGVELDQDVQVLQTPEAVKTDFRRTISPGLGLCLAHQLGKLAGVTWVSVGRLPFPRTGSVSALYRAELTVKTAQGLTRLVSDYVFFGDGRTRYEFTVIAPLDTKDQLMRFEASLAQILLRRAGAQTA
jgi:hypothetical protein